MIQYEYFNSNIDTYEILLLMDEWDSEYCMDAPSTFHMREIYVLRYQIYDPDTTTYMEALSGEHVYEYYNYMYDKILILIRR